MLNSLLEQNTALYTELDREYGQAMSGPYEEIVVFDGLGCAAVAGLKNGRVSGFWRPVVVFGDADYQQKRIEGLWAVSQDIYYQDYLVDGALSPISRFLLGKGYFAEPYYTQVVNLTRSVDDLRRELRKSYHSLVNRLEDIESCGVDQFQAIHERIKGVTRPATTWQIQKRMETVCVRRRDGRGAVMFYRGPVWAYYASAAGEDSHACIWQALLRLKALGVQYAEMGEQKLAGSPKEVNISRFKAGFSGQTRVRLNLVKGPT